MLEYIEIIDKNEEIKKKVLSNAKSKYLKSLGIYNNFSQGLGVIKESDNEYNDEKFRLATDKELSKEQIRDLLVSAVKNNKLMQLNDLMETYTFDINSLGKCGWNLLHYACKLGHHDIAFELITRYNADVNLPNIDDWTPLHLCSYKGHQEIIKILMFKEETNINVNVLSIGTPLHCACKKIICKLYHYSLTKQILKF